MVDLSRRSLVTGAVAGVAVALPGPAAPRAERPGYARLFRAIDEDIGGLARDPLVVVGRIQGHLTRAVEAGLFDAWRGQPVLENDKLALLRGGGVGGRWKVQLFRVAAGRSHPPHCHENLASCLVVLDGRLHVREYERLRDRETDEATTLRRVFDDELRPGQAILTAENHRNAHWFGADGAPALAINFKASGYFRQELFRLRNRRYLDPAGETGGPFRAPFIAAAEAKARFGRRML